MLFCDRCFKLWTDSTDVAACDCGKSICEMQTTPTIHPVQIARGGRGTVRAEVAFAAYEVYCKVFAPRTALVTGGCRGGFGGGELVAFLYAKSFSKAEWKSRFNEALENMKLD